MMDTETQKAVLKQGDESMREKIRSQFNNEATGNIVLLVNGSKFHAHKSILVLSCEYFHSWFKEGFEESTIEEIQIHVKYTDSFLTILEYIYCLDINISALNHNVLAEVLHLVDFYGLTEFSKNLEIYVTKLDKFDNDAVIPLINIAGTRKLTTFYNSLKHHICDNAKLFLEHEKFQTLQYDVLLDLIKCDWLYVSEVDILKAVILWHHRNIASECTGVSNLNINTKLWLKSILINCLQFGVTYNLFTKNIIPIYGLLLIKSIYLAFYSRSHHSITIPDNIHDLSQTELLTLLEKSSTKLKDLLKQIRFNWISLFQFENMMAQIPELSDYRDIICSFRNMHFNSNSRYKLKDEILQFTFNIPRDNLLDYITNFALMQSPTGFTATSNELLSGGYRMTMVFFTNSNDQEMCRFILESTSNKNMKVFPIYLISQNPFQKNVQLNFEYRKSPKEVCYTTSSEFEAWNNLSVGDILAEDSGYIQDGILIVKVHVNSKVRAGSRRGLEQAVTHSRKNPGQHFCRYIYICLLLSRFLFG